MSATTHPTQDDYIKLEKLGEGTYGVVYKARHRKTNKVLTVSSLRLTFLTRHFCPYFVGIRPCYFSVRVRCRYAPNIRSFLMPSCSRFPFDPRFPLCLPQFPLFVQYFFHPHALVVLILAIIFFSLSIVRLHCLFDFFLRLHYIVAEFPISDRRDEEDPSRV